MIELTFQEFHEHRYRENQYCLYVLKNQLGEILYVGISTNNIWERWFGWGGHIVWDANVIYGESSVGTKIKDHLPDSLQWRIQLWTMHDCMKFCRKELPKEVLDFTVHDIEPVMIQKLSPSLNVIYNLSPGKDTTPKSKEQIEREIYLDEMYKKIFNK